LALLIFEINQSVRYPPSVTLPDGVIHLPSLQQQSLKFGSKPLGLNPSFS